MLVCYKCLVGGRRLVSPAARRDLLSSPNYPCKSREKRRADERTRTAFLLQLRVNCSYWTILCFTLLDNRRYQRERRCVMRCNGRLLIEIRVLRLQSVAILLHKPQMSHATASRQSSRSRCTFTV